jgi:hypothetical protein
VSRLLPRLLPVRREPTRGSSPEPAACDIDQRNQMTRGLRALGGVDLPDPLRAGIIRVLVALDALGATTRGCVFSKTKMDRAWFRLCWEEARSAGLIGVAGHDGQMAIYALLLAGETEVAKLSTKEELSSFARHDIEPHRSKRQAACQLPA